MENINTREELKKVSTTFSQNENLIIILAAGHGKRIKSSTSKMLHPIWGVPTVERVRHAMNSGIGDNNTIIVVGIKALEVASIVGIHENNSFVFQEEQNGTGDAVNIALKNVEIPKSTKYCYIIYADMGLIDSEAISQFKVSFVESNTDMMALTGIFEGDEKDNYYGRIIRTKEFTLDGTKSKYKDFVIEIKEHKDILALDKNYISKYKDETFEFTKSELLSIKEYNTGVYGFKIEYLQKYIDYLQTNNAQKELYITDLISIFNNENLSVGAVSPIKMYVVLGFNNKSVLKEMEDIARNNIYQKIKDIITIADKDDFFIADDVLENIIELDKKDKPLDIYIGKGVRIESGVSINYGLMLHENVILSGNIILGTNVIIHDRARITTFEGQEFIISDNVEIMHTNHLQGHVSIGKNTRIERHVCITGSDTEPVIIGSNVLIKGTSYIYGCKIDDNVYIEGSTLYNKHIKAIYNSDNKIIHIKFIAPEPEGENAIEDL